MKTVKFSPAGGPVMLSVESGPPCIGGFQLYYRDNIAGTAGRIYENEANLIHDDNPDRLPLPFTHQMLPKITLRIVGRYGPLPDHTQIGVRYVFSQDGKELEVSGIQENHNSPPPYKEFKHDFEFQPSN